MRHLKRWIVVGAGLVVLSCVCGCGTIRGIGHDMQTVGIWLEQQEEH
jgi:predicted small secreted protein